MILAAVDLGSNSFRCEIVKIGLGKLYSCRYLKETVRLAGGLQADQTLSEEVIQKAEAALTTFNRALGSLPAEFVYAVGTQAFRAAKNGEQVLARCEKALGYPIKLLTGHEEAVLAYQGCARALGPSDKKRLVVDIGGGSTELIIGQHFDATKMESIPIGCVNTSMKFFKDGVINAERFEQAIAACEQAFMPYKSLFEYPQFQEAYGSAGTFGAILDVQGAFTWRHEVNVTLPMLEELKQELITLGNVQNINYPHLKVDRREVLPGGLATLIATYKVLNIQSMRSAIGALRLGLIFELIKKHLPNDNVLTATYI